VTAATIRRRIEAEVRIDESRREADAMVRELQKWVADRRERDVLGQYRTQIAYIGSALTGALDALRAAIEAIDERGPRGDVFRACRGMDRRLALIRRTWSYFRSKFAQRDDPRTAAVLASADELVWSCHATAHRALGSVTLPPAPLAFIDDQDTPAAVPRDEPPRELRPTNDDEIVREHLRVLAVPVIALTFKSVVDPWWLGLVTHEAGHHLQFDLLPESGLVFNYRDAMRRAAATVLDERAAEEWSGWADEVFADVCSVCCLGPWSLSLVELLEADDERTMLSRRRARYPPPIARLALMNDVAARLGLGTSAVWAATEPLLEGDALDERGRDVRAAAAQDFAAMSTLSAAACTPPGIPELARVYRVEPAAFRTAVGYWRDGLLGRTQVLPERSLRAPWRVAAGALAAWEEVAAEPDGVRREEERAALAERLLELLPDCREEGTRAAEATAVPDAAAAGRALAQDLLSLEVEA
jgi:hypothetical protein